MRKIRLICFAFLLTVASICAQSAMANDFTGDWSGQWNDYDGTSGGLSFSLTQSGSYLSGTMNVLSTECGDFYDLDVSGTVSGSSASFEASAYCSADGSTNILKYTSGSISGNVVSGEYVVYSDGDYYTGGTFSVTRSVNIITAGAGTGGSIDPTGIVYVNAGSSRTFTITPNTGYRILDVKVDGSSVGAVTSYTFSYISSNYTIAATFMRVYTITASDGPGGSIDPSGSVPVDSGADQYFTFTPDPGYRVVSILFDGELLEARDWPACVVNNVVADHTLKVIFERIGTMPWVPLLLLDD